MPVTAQLHSIRADRGSGANPRSPLFRRSQSAVSASAAEELEASMLEAARSSRLSTKALRERFTHLRQPGKSAELQLITERVAEALQQY